MSTQPTSPSVRQTSGGLVVISGPSGAGKSTVVRELVSNCSLPLTVSVSATTRPPRPGETDGIHYHFLSREEFAKRRAADEFLECKEVFGRGDWYGTLQSEVATGLAAQKWVILEIDVEGAQSVLKRHPDTLTIFVHCGSLAELERRLRSRNSDSEDAIKRRLEVARRELSFSHTYNYQVDNQDVAESVRTICDILKRHGETSA